MEKVTKVNLGGISFTLENTAYGIVRKYLDTLEEHYHGNDNGAEIIESIESRIAELFIDRGGKSGTITEAMALEVLNIIGKPEDIFGDAEEACSSHPDGETHKKKLYRNPDDKKVGGVCGGLAAYFKLDPVWFRIAYAALLALTVFTAKENWWNPMFPIIIYCILWIAMPLARTTAQKCEMYGESLSLDDIERQVINRKEFESSKSGGSGLFGIAARIFLIFVGLLLLIIGLSGIIALFGLFFGIAVAGLTVPGAITALVAAIAGLPLWVAVTMKILAALAVLLPFVGMLYGGIALLFNFKNPKWKPGLIIFILWIVSLMGLAVALVTTSSKFWNVEDSFRSFPVETAGDSLHIEFEGLEQWKDSKVYIDGDQNEFEMFFMDASNKTSPKAVAYPEIQIHRGKESASGRMITKYFKNMFSLEEIQNAEPFSYCRFSADTLFVSPVIYDREHEMKEFDMCIVLKLPDSLNVSISKPVEHDFTKHVEFTNMKIGLIREFLD